MCNSPVTSSPATPPSSCFAAKFCITCFSTALQQENKVVAARDPNSALGAELVTRVLLIATAAGSRSTFPSLLRHASSARMALLTHGRIRIHPDMMSMYR